MKNLALFAILLLTSLTTFSQNLVEVRRYFHNEGNYSVHFYTTTPEELTGCNCGPWVGETSLGYLYNSNYWSWSVPVYRFVNGGRHYYSKDFSAPAGFTYEKVLGYFQDFPPGQGGTIYPKLFPVREYLAPNGDYLYTSDVTQESLNGLTFQRIAFYVYKYTVNN